VTRPIAHSHRVSQRGRRKVRSVGSTVFGALLGVALGLVFLAPGPACANEQRRNTPSFGVQGGYGALNGTGAFEWEDNDPTQPNRTYAHEDYRYGAALGFHIRYSLDQSHAVGVTFEDLRYDRKTFKDLPEADLAKIAKQLQVTTYLIDYYLYLNRRARATPYLLIGGGFNRGTFRFKKHDYVATAIGPCANVGIGVEYFFWPALSMETTLRGAWFGQRDGGQLHWMGGGSTVAASAQIGFQYYLIK
jgi:opacity protein-like surface antigen